MNPDLQPACRTARAQLTQQLFPGGIPALWCPPLTHYAPDGRIDRERIAAHWRFMSQWVGGFLVPGTTGDAWELTPSEASELLEIALDETLSQECHLLLGALHADAVEAERTITARLQMLQQRSGTQTIEDALARTRVCGFTVCPPRGAKVTQEEMQRALSGILRLGAPLALYQLPQFTLNEMDPELVAGLASTFANLTLLKDTSGKDRVAQSSLDLSGVFLVRGMEGQYASWLKLGGGCYDGFLLSTANSFAAQIHEIRELLVAGRKSEANALSARLEAVVQDLFQIVDAVQQGNKLANANKVADHFYAFGPRAEHLPPPRLHSGNGLTQQLIRAGGESLKRHGLMPVRGYLE